MRLLKDFEGRTFRFTDERIGHVSGHPEMEPMMQAIEETLARPERVVQSLADPEPGFITASTGPQRWEKSIFV